MLRDSHLVRQAMDEDGIKGGRVDPSVLSSGFEVVPPIIHRFVEQEDHKPREEGGPGSSSP